MRVEVYSPSLSKYIFTVSEKNDSGGSFEEMFVGYTQDVSIYRLLSKKKKFILDRMDSWELTGVIASGDAKIFVGLDPDTVATGGHTWEAKKVGNKLKVSIR